MNSADPQRPSCFNKQCFNIDASFRCVIVDVSLSQVRLLVQLSLKSVDVVVDNRDGQNDQCDDPFNADGDPVIYE